MPYEVAEGIDSEEVRHRCHLKAVKRHSGRSGAGGEKAVGGQGWVVKAHSGRPGKGDEKAV